jgi:hypothetical protein
LEAFVPIDAELKKGLADLKFGSIEFEWRGFEKGLEKGMLTHESISCDLNIVRTVKTSTKRFSR